MIAESSADERDQVADRGVAELDPECWSEVEGDVGEAAAAALVVERRDDEMEDMVPVLDPPSPHKRRSVSSSPAKRVGFLLVFGVLMMQLFLRHSCAAAVPPIFWGRPAVG